MVVPGTRVVTQMLSNPNLRKDAGVVLDELDRLSNYYESEIKQRKIEHQQYLKEGNLEALNYTKGLMVAYSDHLAEIHYIEAVIRGLNREIKETVTT